MDLSRAQENVRNAMSNHPNAKTLIGLWSYNGPAIVKVVGERGKRSEYTAVTFDAEQASISNMEQGQLDCMLVQNPYEIGYQSVRLMAALIENNEAIVKEMFPKHGQPGGDIFETGVKVVVPNDKSPLKKEMFGEKAEFLTLEKFKAWLTKYGLSCS
jgi:ribose transport system substrate-binding protein